MEVKIKCRVIKKTKDVVYLKFEVFERVHAFLSGFLLELDKFLEEDMLKVDLDFENLENYEDYNCLESESFKVHVIAFGGKDGHIHLIIEPKNGESRKRMIKAISKYFAFAPGRFTFADIEAD